MWISSAAAFLFLFLPLIAANVEKLIFLGPKNSDVQPQLLSHAFGSHLDILSPANYTIRHRLLAAFASDPVPKQDSETWILLQDLETGRRYEVRVCWSATVSDDIHNNVLPMIFPWLTFSEAAHCF